MIFAIFTKVRRVFFAIFAVIFYCPYTCMMIKFLQYTKNEENIHLHPSFKGHFLGYLEHCS